MCFERESGDWYKFTSTFRYCVVFLALSRRFFWYDSHYLDKKDKKSKDVLLSVTEV